MGDERLRDLKRAADHGGLLDRLALDAETLRQRGTVEHPGPPTRFPSLALYLEDPFESPTRTDPRDDPAFRALLADAGEWETLRVWVIMAARRQLPTGGHLTWTLRARPVASAVVGLTAGWPEKEKRKAFAEANPFGTTASWPAKAWRNAVRLARALKPTSDRRRKAPDPTGELFS